MQYPSARAQPKEIRGWGWDCLEDPNPFQQGAGKGMGCQDSSFGKRSCLLHRKAHRGHSNMVANANANSDSP